MAKIFEVGPLPQITPPAILDTNPLVPFDVANMGKALNDKAQLDIYKANAERQRQVMELTFMDKFADNLRQLLKTSDGKSLNPISPFHQTTYDRVNTQINEAVGKMSDLIEAEDYRGAYKTMFDVGAKIGQDKDYKRFLQETGLFNDILSDKNLDPYAVTQLYKDLQKSNTAFDLTRFDRSTLALYDEPASVKAFLDAIKPEEVLGYDGYKYETQQTPEAIRANLANQIKNDPSWVNFLKNRGVDVNNTDQLNKYINSKVAGNLVGEKMGAEFSYQTVDGKQVLVGVKRLVGFEKGLNDASTAAKGGDNIFAGVWDNANAKTQATVRATEETVSYPAFRSAFRAAHDEYYNVRQAVDAQLEGKEVVGLTSTGSGDMVQDILMTVRDLGLKGAKEAIRITKPDGTIDEATEATLFEKVLPRATEAYANKERLAKGSESLLEGTFDKFKSAYEKKGLSVPFEALGITKGPKGEVIFPEGFDLDTRESDPNTAKQISSGVGLGTAGVSYGDPDKNAREARNFVRDLHVEIVDNNLKKRYTDFFEPDGDHLKYFMLPDETSVDFEPFRTMTNSVKDLVKTDQLSFFSSNEAANQGLPMTLRLLTEKDRAQGLDAKKAWNDVDITGLGFDPETGSFFLAGYPRVAMSKTEYETYTSGKSKDKFTDVIPEEEKGNFYLRSKHGIVIPWNGFDERVYQSFLNRHGSYEGLYNSIVGAMEEKVPEGQPVMLQIGDQTLYITPKGPIGSEKMYEMTSPGPVSAAIESQGTLPPNTTSNTSPVDRTYSTLPPPPKPDSTANQQVVDGLTDLVDKYPHLGDVVPKGPMKQGESIYGERLDIALEAGRLAKAQKAADPIAEADLLKSAEASLKVYDTDALGLKTLLERGTAYLGNLTPEDREKVLEPSNFEALEFKSNQYGTNTPLKVSNKTAAALAHFNQYVSENFDPKFKGVVTDTFRTKQQNEGTKGSGDNSRHLYGDAFDLSLNRGAGPIIAQSLEFAKNQGPKEYSAALTEIFGTDKVKFEIHEGGTAPHIHVEIL